VESQQRASSAPLNLIALGVGTLEYALLVAMVLVSIRVWPDLPSLVIDSIPLSWPWRWVLGFPWAFLIRGWLLSMWPSIEFNFGSTYLRLENRRKKLKWTLTAVIIPIIIALFYDVMKGLFIIK
jgi:hypothetical protein